MADVIEEFNNSLAYVPPPLDASGQVIPDPDIQAKLNPPVPEPEPEQGNVDIQEKEDRGGIGSNFVSRSARFLQFAEGRARQAYDWTASQPTPGGSGAILTAILLILFVAVPVTAQNKSRLELVYYTLMGRTFLQGRKSPLGDQGSNVNTVGMPGAYSDQPAAEILYNAQSPVDYKDL